jgi:histone-binding protein RBBP4
VDIFDYFKHPKTPVNDEVKPDLRLIGHTQEGYGLAWNPIKRGLLLSGSDDCKACVWDVNATNSNQVTQEPMLSLNAAHSSIIEDVAWNNFDQYIFASVGDDKKLKIWDTRDAKRATSCIEGHVQEIMSVDCSPFDQFLMLTGSADTTVAVWDMRNVKTKLFSLRSHTKDVNNVRFSRMQSNLLASSSHDRRVMIWDLSRFDKP